MVNWVEIRPHVFNKLTESTPDGSACGGLTCVGAAGRASPPPGLAREGFRPACADTMQSMPGKGQQTSFTPCTNSTVDGRHRGGTRNASTYPERGLIDWLTLIID